MTHLGKVKEKSSWPGDMGYFKDKISILDVVQYYVSSIKKQGQSYVTLCPFHNEKTPSFHIYAPKNRFHCFGCQKNGDAIQFVREIEGVGFVDAVKRVAEICHIPVPESFFKPESADVQEKKKKTVQRHDYLLGLLKETNSFYYNNFLNHYKRSAQTKANSPTQNADSPVEYLRTRGLSLERIQKIQESFSIGYAPEGWDNLIQHLRQKGFSEKDMVAVGVAGSKKENQFYDAMRRRLIFPIRDEKGKVIAFGGRALEGETQPKYLNSADNEFFHKKEFFYGLDLALPVVRQSKRVFIMEGYLDVIASHLNGVTNSVATLGTAVSQEHLEKIGKLAQEIFLVFDADNAGKKAAVRVASLTRNRPERYRIIHLPDGKDPFDYFQRHDAVEFFSLVDRSTDLWEYELSYCISEMGEQDGLNQAFAALQSFQSEIRREKGFVLLAQWMRVSLEAIKKDYAFFQKNNPNKDRKTRIYNQPFSEISVNLSGEIRSGKGYPVSSEIIKEIQKNSSALREMAVTKPIMKRETPLSKFGHYLLLLVLAEASLVEKLMNDSFQITDFEDAMDQQIFQKINEAVQEGKIINIENLHELELTAEEESKLHGELIRLYDENKEDLVQRYNIQQAQLKLALTEYEIQIVKNKISEQTENSELFSDLEALNQTKVKFSQYINNSKIV